MSAGAHPTIPLKTFYMVLGFLLFMTLVTVVTAKFMDFGSFNAVIAMAIASAKAYFVLAYFMHLKYDDRIHLVLFLLSIFFLLVMFFFSQLDIATRVPWVDIL